MFNRGSDNVRSVLTGYFQYVG